MTIRVQAQDGTIQTFPDGTSPAAETKWGQSRLGHDYNNYFSQQYGRRVPFTTGSTPALKSGVPMSTFASYADAAKAFGALYGRAVDGKSDPAAFAQALVNAHYNSTDPATNGKRDFVPFTAGVIDMTRRRMKCP